MYRILVSLVVFVMMLPAQTFAVTDAEQTLLREVANGYRANMATSKTLEYEYTYASAGGAGSQPAYTKVGRFIDSGDRQYSVDTTRNAAGEQIMRIEYAQDGDDARVTLYDNPRLIRVGSTAKHTLRHGMQVWWRHAGHDLAHRLDRLQPDDGEIKSVAEGMLDGEPCIIVRLEQPLPGDNKDAVHHRTFYFAKNKGYLPVLIEFKVANWTHPAVRGTMTVEDITTLVIDGRTMFLPTRIEANALDGDGVVIEDKTYTIKTESIRFNHDLPADQFTIPLQPDDQVIDVNTNKEIPNLLRQQSP